MTLLLGLTGSIGMGKSTTARFFQHAGVPVWDADHVVHEVYSKGNSGAAALKYLVPEAVIEGAVDRGVLRELINKDDGLLDKIEQIVHPLIQQDRENFIDSHSDKPLILFDIPILFETNAQRWLDKVVVVTAPASVQKTRVLARKTMTEAQLNSILKRQMPDAQKRAKADYIIDTSNGLDAAKNDVLDLIKTLTGNP